MRILTRLAVGRIFVVGALSFVFVALTFILSDFRIQLGSAVGYPLLCLGQWLFFDTALRAALYIALLAQEPLDFLDVGQVSLALVFKMFPAVLSHQQF